MALPPEARGGRPRRRKAAPRRASRPVFHVAPAARAYVSQGRAVERVANQQRRRRTRAFSPRPTVPRVVSRPSPQVKRVNHELGIQSRSAQASRRTAAARRSTPRGTPGRAMLERERHRQIARTRTERKAARHPEVRDALTNKRALGALDAARPALLQQVTKELDRQVKARDNARPVSALGFNLPFSKGAGQAVISTARKVGATIGGQGIQALLHTNSDFLQKRGEAAGTDVVDLVTNAVPSTYALGREIVKGHERKALNMILDPYKQLAEHPVKSFSEHPVLSSLLLSGTYGGVGRTTGGILRHSPSETLRAIGTTHAPARTKVIPGTGVNILGTYSPNVITKAGQVARDRRRGAPDIIPKGNEQARYANSFIGREEDIRRVDRNIADRQSHNDIRLKDKGP